MTLPSNEHEVFEDCVQKAHDIHGALLPIEVQNELERMARSIGYEADLRSGYDYGSEPEK